MCIYSFSIIVEMGQKSKWRSENCFREEELVLKKFIFERPGEFLYNRQKNRKERTKEMEREKKIRIGSALGLAGAVV